MLYSGNYMGDLGARMLAKALMINTHLTTIFWDKNLTSANGFTDVAAALQKLVFILFKLIDFTKDLFQKY